MTLGALDVDVNYQIGRTTTNVTGIRNQDSGITIQGWARDQAGGFRLEPCFPRS
jgi:hypothetical protein